MLKLSDDDARRYASATREFKNRLAVAGKAKQLRLVFRRHQYVGRKAVGLVFLLGRYHVRAFEEQGVLTVKNQMPRLVKEGEPKMIVGKITEAQKQERFI